MTTMKIVKIYQQGDVDVLQFEDAPIPTIEQDEVLIRVQALGVNPLDWKLRSGYFPLKDPDDFPRVLGFDVAGEVVATGSAVTQFVVGDLVYGVPNNGGYAEYVCAFAADLARIPSTTNVIQAAALPCATITAWQALFDSAQLAAGQTVLIHGAAGGVGTMAIQLAKWRGARVIGTASAHNHAFLQELGADEVIDYTTTRFEEVVSPVDVVFDTVGGETLHRSWKVLKHGGRLRTIASDDAPQLAAKYGIDASGYEIQSPFGATLTEIAGLVDNGHLKPVVSTVLPFQEVKQAHRLSEGRHVRGKIVLML